MGQTSAVEHKVFCTTWGCARCATSPRSSRPGGRTGEVERQVHRRGGDVWRA